MSPIIFRLSFCLFLLLVICWFPLLETLAEPRVEIALFKYRGVQEGGKAEEKFRNFFGIIEDKLYNLRTEVLEQSKDQSIDEKLDYLNKLHIKLREKDSFTKTEGVHAWMENEPEVLTLLRGDIISDDDKTYIVYSKFYLRDLKERFPFDIVTVTLPIKATEFGNTIDSHSLVFLYALAMDAKRLNYSKSNIALFLKTALNKIEDIKRRSETLSRDLDAMENAIRKAVNELLGG